MLAIAGLLLAATCTPLPTCSPTLVTNCATPTMVISWQQNPDADLAGYNVYWKLNGAGLWGLMVKLPCQFYDHDDNPATPDVRFCPGVNGGIPVQRYPGCAAGNLCDYAVKAYDTANQESLLYSNVLTECPSPIWPGKPAPYTYQ